MGASHYISHEFSHAPRKISAIAWILWSPCWLFKAFTWPGTPTGVIPDGGFRMGIPDSWMVYDGKILYFVWSPPWHLYILLLANLLAFYLTFYLAFYLAYLLAFYLAYVRAYLLAFYLAYLIAFYLAYLLAFYLAVEVQRCTLSWAGPRLRSSGAHWAGKLAKSLAKSWQGGSWGGSWCRHGRGETGGGGRGGGGRGGGRGRGGQLAEENNSDKI